MVFDRQSFSVLYALAHLIAMSGGSEGSSVLVTSIKSNPDTFFAILQQQ